MTNRTQIADLDKIGKEIVAKLQELLRVKNKIATGELSENISYQIIQSSNGPTIQINTLPYFDFIEKGRKPSLKIQNNRAYGLPPEKPILDWMRKKNIPVKYAYGIRYNIARFGIKGIFIIDDVLDSTLEPIAEEIAEQYAIFIAEEIANNINSTKSININL